MAYIVAEPCKGIGCAKCVDVCIADCIEVAALEDTYRIDLDWCLECGFCELVEDIEQEAIKVVERLGFAKAESLEGFVKDMDGRPHNLIIMDLPLEIWPDWWAF